MGPMWSQNLHNKERPSGNEMKMGRFSRLLQAKGKDVDIDGEVFNIKPLSAKYLGLLMEGSDDKAKQTKAMFELITVSLQQSDSNITQEDILEMPIQYINKIMNIILEVNELDKD